MDFTKLENITFTAVSGALALFLIIMAFYIISKGYRKTSGLDIFLRIVSALVLIVSAGLFALAIFTGLTGSFRIAAAGDKAVFIIGESATELPLGALFVALSTSTGQTIVIALFVIAFMTLVADCLLAKKKYGKKAKTEKAKKTPEELKREAELQKIRKLSESAVKKSNSAANAADKTTADAGKTKPTEKAEEEKKPVDDEEESFDWRVDTQPKKNEFVGISETKEDDFDSFDSFDSELDEQTDNVTEETSELDEFSETDEAEINAETDETEETEDNGGAYSSADEKPWYEQDDPADERIIAEVLGGDSRSTYETTEHTETVETVTETSETTTEEYVESDETNADVAEDEYAEYDDVKADAPAESEEKRTAATGYNDYYAANGIYGEYSHDIEPDRNIYIPGIRTVNRQPRDEKKTANQKPAATKPTTKPASKSATKPAAKPTTQKPMAKKPAARKPAAQKPATPKPAAAKPAAKPVAKKPTAPKPAAKKQAETVKPDPRKLPMTRRYVILDRTNAVNIFSKYLKEREQADKDKLESSINTIIIK